MDILALLILGLGIAVMIALSIIDLKTWLLPDKLNLALGVLGLGFHLTLGFQLFPPHELIFAALIGAGILYVIRFFGNRAYNQDTLGLGDVKLLGAAGLWLGIEGVIMAMTLGAFAGILHGVGVAAFKTMRHKEAFSLKRLAIPAGPGFCIGIFITMMWVLVPFLLEG
jgi:leader peptidase (prepilin peptidase) / N-methyltransferase